MARDVGCDQAQRIDTSQPLVIVRRPFLLGEQVQFGATGNKRVDAIAPKERLHERDQLPRRAVSFDLVYDLVMDDRLIAVARQNDAAIHLTPPRMAFKDPGLAAADSTEQEAPLFALLQGV